MSEKICQIPRWKHTRCWTKAAKKRRVAANCRPTPAMDGVGDQAYLQRSCKGTSLHIKTRANKQRIASDRGIATGVHYQFRDPNGDVTDHVAHARCEVILIAGPSYSTKLLELSGIDHGGRLQQLCLPVLHESAGVGKNLMDYLRVAISMRCLYPIYEYGTRSPFI